MILGQLLQLTLSQFWLSYNRMCVIMLLGCRCAQCTECSSRISLQITPFFSAMASIQLSWRPKFSAGYYQTFLSSLVLAIPKLCTCNNAPQKLLLLQTKITPDKIKSSELMQLSFLSRAFPGEGLSQCSRANWLNIVKISLVFWRRLNAFSTEYNNSFQLKRK